ncbi:MAG: hypothetical protein MJK14_25880 [Rivularia sp. ALOHA_DT_140]|nr:hypothetical protein [Rivularia sp. ALOHA_DT_140]
MTNYQLPITNYQL